MVSVNQSGVFKLFTNMSEPCKLVIKEPTSGETKSLNRPTSHLVYFFVLPNDDDFLPVSI